MQKSSRQYDAVNVRDCSSVWKGDAREQGSVQQVFCACVDQNVESVILTSTDLFLWLLHYAFHDSSLTIFYIC